MLWKSWPRRESSSAAKTAHFGNAWTRCGKRRCSRKCGATARLRGKPGSNAMKILVTGHSGYIGTILSQMLLQSGHQVVGIDIDLYARCTFGLDVATPIPCIDCDIRELTVAQLKGFDAIAHLAGVCNDPLGDLLPETTYALNEKATIRLAELAVEAGGGRFIFSPRFSAFRAPPHDLVDETSPP